MIGVVVVTHGDLSKELRKALEHIVGHQERMETLSIAPDDDVEARRQEILAAVKTVNNGQGVIVLTDLFGGTPSNLALSTLKAGEVDIIAGVNLPMMVKLASVRSEMTLANAVVAVETAAKKYITVASRTLSQ